MSCEMNNVSIPVGWTRQAASGLNKVAEMTELVIGKSFASVIN